MALMIALILVAAGGVRAAPAQFPNATNATAFLRANAPPWDVLNAGTLFGAGGIVNTSVNISLTAAAEFPWARSVPASVWQQAVLPYANVNEARTDWRKHFWAALAPLARRWAAANASLGLEGAARMANAAIWSPGVLGAHQVVFRSDQTPLIYDPMSTLVFGYASCTGVSILYVDALRTIGVPARLVGTPAWHGVVANGNHNWVEVYLGAGQDPFKDGWGFIEGRPAGSAAETFTDPCDKWFCHKGQFVNTSVFAAQWSHAGAPGVVYPMSWDVGNQAIAGVDRSALYQAACAKC